MKIYRELSFSEELFIKEKVSILGNMHFFKKINFEKAKKVLNAICNKYEPLKSKVTLLQNKYFFIFDNSPEEMQVTTYFDLSRENLASILEKEINFQIGCDQSLIKFSLFSLKNDPDSLSGLFVVASHAIFDGSTLLLFFHEFLRCYFGNEDINPSELILISEPLENLLPHFSIEEKNDVINKMTERYLSLKDLPNNTPQESYKVHFISEAFPFENISAICALHKIKVHGFLMAHFIKTLAKFYPLPPGEICCVTTVDYRKYLLEQDSHKLDMANASGGYRAFYANDLPSNTIEFAKRINVDLQNALKNGEAVLQFALKKEISEKIGFIPVFCIVANLGCIDKLSHKDEISFFSTMIVNYKKDMPFLVISTLNNKITLTLIKYSENDPKELALLDNIMNSLKKSLNTCLRYPDSNENGEGYFS